MREQRPGVVLVAVLLIIVVLSLAAYQYSEWMSSEYRAADQAVRSAQARALAESGIHYAAALLADSNSLTTTLNNNPFNQPSAFQNILVLPDERSRRQGRFSIVSPLGLDETASGTDSFRYGVSDEGAKINVNALLQLDSSGQVLHDVLMKLPNMSEEIANAIVDWIDPDDEARTNGAENTYYSALTPPYRCKNGPLDSLEELLLVRGVTPQLLFGNDRNRNGIFDAGEDDGAGAFDGGWAQYLTIYSRYRNVDSTGQTRVFLNDSDASGELAKLAQIVDPELAAYIVAYRIYGGSQATSGRSSNNARQGASGSLLAEVNRAIARGSVRMRSLSSLYELVGTQVSVPAPDGRSQTVYTCPLNSPAKLKEQLPKLLDGCTTRQREELPARVNVNTAPRAVLACLPGLTESDVQSILDRRPDPSSGEAPDAIFSTTAWLMTEANIPARTMQTLEQYVTTRSQVYRVQSIGYFDVGGPMARLEAVIDANASTPRILYLRDISELGRGFALSGQ